MKAIYTFDADLPILLIEWVPVTYTYPLHWHTCLEIGYCTTGSGWFHFSDKTYEVQAGDIFIVNNVEKHMTQACIENPNHFYFIKFDISLLEDYEKELLLPFVYDPKHFNNKISHEHPLAARIGTLVKTMWEESQQQSPAYQLLLRSSLVTICVLLLRHFKQQIGQADRNWQQAVNQFMKLQPAITYIRDHYREQISLEDISAQISLSPSRTYHLFKEMTGKGFKEYVSMLRINKAKELLIETTQTTMEICYACGFQSHTPFYRAFKKLVGMTPQEYREQYSLLQLV